MMTVWAYHNPVQIKFGNGSRKRLSGVTSGRRVLVVSTHRGRGQMESDSLLRKALAGAAELAWVDDVTPNPGLHETQTAIDRMRGKPLDLVVAFGGGSAMDAAKALACALAPTAWTHDLAALIADPSRHMNGACLPLVAVTTTSGTGAEVTPFATIWDHAAKRKLSLVSPTLFPQLAIVDPELTLELPRDPTLSTGLDALNQAFESVWNRNRTPMTIAFAGRAIGLALKALPRLEQDLSDKTARADMAQASLLAGLAISQTRTALCHAMSYPLTAHLGLAHGWACAVTMAAVAKQAFAADPALFDTVAQRAGMASGVVLAKSLQEQLDNLRVGKVAASTADAGQILSLIPEMFTPGRSDNFLLQVTQELLAEIIISSF